MTMTQTQNSSQSDYVVQTILKSGMLLDEDMDYILIHYKPTDICSKNTFSTAQKVLTGFSLTSIVFLMLQKFSIGYVSVAATPLIFVTFQQVSTVFHRREQRRNIEKLIQVIAEICKTNRDIIKYFKQKASPNTASAVNMYTVNMKVFIEVLFKQEIRLLETYRRFVEKAGSYVPILLTDYLELLKNIDLNEFSTTDITDINGCVTYVSKLCDIFLLMTSNTLASLAVTVSSKFLDKYDVSVDDILDTMVPPLKNQSLTCHKTINRKFNDIKYHYLNKHKFKMTLKRSKMDSSSNLCLGTYNMLSQCSNIVEKSQIILKKLDEYPLRTLDEKKLLHKCISELSGEVGEYYESLGILQRLYEVDIGRALPVPTFRGGGSIEAPIESSQINEIVDASLNPTEPAADEEYELFLSGMDSDFEAKDYSSFDEEECRKYAAVLSLELKQKLQEHLRFRAAREKRGIIDEEPENIKKDTSETGVKSEQEPRQCMAEPLLAPMQDSSPPPPPPLPPVEEVAYNFPTKPISPLQLPVTDVGPYGDVLQSSQAGTDFQHVIKLMADKRQIVEDVFECSEAEEKMD